jgi:hypothetical protein
VVGPDPLKGGVDLADALLRQRRAGQRGSQDKPTHFVLSHDEVL